MIDLREGVRTRAPGSGDLCAIAVMAKASAPGRTKTRLCPPLDPTEAAAFNTAFIQDIVGNILAAGRMAPVSAYVAYGPAGAAHFFDAVLPPGVGRMEAVAPGFGACLTMTLAHLFALGHPAAAVLNADSPTLPPALLAELADVLAQPGDRAVLGPSTDGGYYVLGLKTPHWHLFADIDWSTERVFEQTLARAAEIDLPVHVLPPWYDVDDAHALRLLHGELIAGVPFGTAPLARGAARNSTDLLRRLLAQGRLAERLGLPVADIDPPCLRAS
ncbi:TIGR04282 family arsenosugar biosynthesis glycosyltransferase [Xanthobacter sp. 126]|uniref:TIGR04282 family arsenosugar biosynthesis glycosyltransferase n=1 Tax=Xanthobacter sp. 126 TaxID=1131814 RepID=UPI0004B89A89|nr:TIGR04282 family arsenosugar biosynthesis glycosyltransferase [Xanthobacter sp. 126]